jgi:hypothetical protein
MAHGAKRPLGDNIHGIDVVIAADGTTSASVGLSGRALVAIETPGALTSVSLTFLAAQGTTFVPIYSDAGSAYSVTVAASRHILIDPAKLVGVTNLKVVMGSAEAAERTLTLITREID